MYKIDCLENLFHNNSNFFFSKFAVFLSNLFLHKLSKIHIEMFKHYEKASILKFDFFDIDYIRVLDFIQLL